MQPLRSILCTITILFAVQMACIPDKPRLNSPPQGYSEPHHPMSETFAYHNDQAMLADMSVADIHFVPHSSELSGTGEARLARYAELLATTGGTLHYDTAVTDDKLLRSRLAAANDYLKESVPGTKSVKVVVGGAGGRGIVQAEAKSARDVARQAEPRNTAYKLRRYQEEQAGK